MKDNKKKSAKMNDYLEYLENLVKIAEKENCQNLTVTAKEVHDAVSDSPTLPTCCAAMRKFMKVGDKVLVQPETKTGFGSTLKIEYLLEDREKREVMFPPLKRGRKTHASDKKIKTERKPKEEMGLEKAIKNWLNDLQVSYQIIDGNKITVDGEYGQWMILMDLPRKGPKLNFSGKIYDLLSEADENIEKYSLAINSNLSYEAQWKKLPDTIKHKINLTLLKVTSKNKVVEI